MDLSIQKDHRCYSKAFHKVPRGINAIETKTIAIRDMNFINSSSIKQNYLRDEGLILRSYDILEQCSINGLPEKYS